MAHSKPPAALELAALTEHVPGGIHQCLYDPEFTLLTVSRGFLDLFGYTREELRERFQDRYAEMIYHEDRPRVDRTVREQLEQGDAVELEYRVRRKDGGLLWILDKGRLAPGPEGKPCFYSLLLDVTKERGDREELRLSLERHRIIMDQTTDIIFEWDIRRDSLSFSANWRKKFGYDPIQTDISHGIPVSKNIHAEDMPAFVGIMNAAAAGTPYSETEFRIRDSAGTFTWCRIRATVQYDGAGRPVKAVGVIVDIDADKKQRQRLLEQAQRDALTGLLNKGAVRVAVEAVLNQPDQNGGALLILDLDDFKSINDRYGHLCGDAVLSDVAGVLRRQSRAGDVVARIGGDEFLAFLPGADRAGAGRWAGDVLEALGGITVFGASGKVSCSVGAAVRPGDADDFPALFRCADQALYQVKSRGKGSFASYAPAMEADRPSGRAARSAVGAAIDSDIGVVDQKLGQYCFRMLYQAEEPKAAIQQILEIVGRAYDVSRAAIYEIDRGGKTYSNTFEWCGPDIRPEMEHLQNLPCEAAPGGCGKHFNEAGVFCCEDVRTLDEGLRSHMAGRGICSFLRCAILDDGRFRGCVSFDECRAARSWSKGRIETLTLVANVLSTFLLKMRLKERLEQDAEEAG